MLWVGTRVVVGSSDMHSKALEACEQAELFIVELTLVVVYSHTFTLACTAQPLM